MARGSNENLSGSGTFLLGDAWERKHQRWNGKPIERLSMRSESERMSEEGADVRHQEAGKGG